MKYLTLYQSAHGYREKGFSLLELAVVVAILSILAGISIPAIGRWISLSKIDAVKTLLDVSASECLQKVREGNAPEEYSPSTNTISNDRLSGYGYQIKSTDTTCSSFFLVPLREDDTFLYQLGFKISASGEIVKVAVPTSDTGSFNSCKNWAGVNCGVSAEQQAIWDTLAKIEKDKKTCNDNFYAWLQNPQKPGTGAMNRWDEKTKSCSLETWALEGSIQRDETGYKAAEKAKYGAICSQKTTAEKEKKTTQGPVKIAECGEREFYFCLGDDKGTLEALQICIAQNKQAACLAAKEQKRASNFSGEYISECGDASWMCNGTIYMTSADYDKNCKPKCPEPLYDVCYDSPWLWDNWRCKEWAKCKGLI